MLIMIRQALAEFTLEIMVLCYSLIIGIDGQRYKQETEKLRDLITWNRSLLQTQEGEGNNRLTSGSLGACH